MYESRGMVVIFYQVCVRDGNEKSMGADVSGFILYQTETAEINAISHRLGTEQVSLALAVHTPISYRSLIYKPTTWRGWDMYWSWISAIFCAQLSYD